MADSIGMIDLRTEDIQTMVTGFADEPLVFLKYVRKAKTSSSKFVYYSKAGGYLSTTDSTDMTASRIEQSKLSIPEVAESEWTKNTGFTKKWALETRWVSESDLRDAAIDVWAGNIQDITNAVLNERDAHIYKVISDTVTSVPADGSSVPSGAATADGWDDVATGDPIADILTAQNSLRAYSYNPEGAIIAMHADDYKNLIKYLINVKGSSIPGFSSEAVKTGEVMGLLGCRIVVSNNCTTDYVVMFLAGKTAVYRELIPMSSAVIVEPGVGRKYRVWTEGLCTLEHPNSAYVITDTQV